jgi:hypothetical protein
MTNRDISAQERKSMINTSTNETCPRHIWQHEVSTLAIRAGADADIVRDLIKDVGVRWYNAGEPVWMAAHDIAVIAKRRKLEQRADREVAVLRSITAKV